VGREEEGSSLNRPELAAFVLELRGTPVTKSILYLCDNYALLKAVKRWVGEGGKATLTMIAFITFNSSLVPLIEGLCSSNPWEFEFSGFRRNQTDDLGINGPST